jgi:hypothetical protein
MITKIRKYISNVIYPWESTLDRTFNVIDDYKEMVKNQDLEISRQFEHSNMLFEKIDDIYEKFLELAKVTMNANVMIQCHLEKEKELTEEIRVLKVIN